MTPEQPKIEPGHVSKRPVQTILDDLNKLTGPVVFSYNEAGQAINRTEVVATRTALFPLIDEISGITKRKPNALTDAQSMQFAIKVVDFGDSGALCDKGADIIRAQILSSADPRATGTQRLFDLMRMEDANGEKVIDIDALPEKLNKNQETLVQLLMKVYLDNPRNPSSGADVLLESNKKTAKGTLIEDLKLPERRVYQFGNWLGSIGSRIGYSAGFGVAIRNTGVPRVNTYLGNMGSSLRASL